MMVDFVHLDGAHRGGDAALHDAADIASELRIERAESQHEDDPAVVLIRHHKPIGIDGHDLEHHRDATGGVEHDVLADAERLPPRGDGRGYCAYWIVVGTFATPRS